MYLLYIFPNAVGIFTNIDHTSVLETNLVKFRKTEIMKFVFFDPKEIILNINNTNKIGSLHCHEEQDIIHKRSFANGSLCLSSLPL